MQHQTTPSGARRIGDEYQIWLGVSLISKWLFSSKSEEIKSQFWLEEEGDKDKSGILDDIILFEDDHYYFYQVKHVISLRGGLITIEKDLFQDESRISLKNLLESYLQIKYKYNPTRFSLILFSNRHAGNNLMPLIEGDGRFDSIIRKLSARAIHKDKVKIIKKLRDLMDELKIEDLSEFLESFYFKLNQENFQGLKESVFRRIENDKLTNKFLGLVSDSHQIQGKRIGYNTLDYHRKLFPYPEPLHSTADEYFEKFLDENTFFNHTEAIVGRDELIDDLNSFVDADNKYIAFLMGSGGCGKSKILYEFGKQYSRASPLLIFLKDNAPINHQMLLFLDINTKYILVIEDVHKRHNLDLLFNTCISHKEHLKLVLSFRPYKKEEIEHELYQAGYDINNILELPEVLPLRRNDARSLATAILGNKFEIYRDRLLERADNVPLLIIIGGKMVSQQLVDVELLEHSKDFRRAALDKYRDVLLGELGDHIDRDMSRKILSLISIISPLNLNNEDMLQTASNFIGVSLDELKRYLSILESSSILIRQGLLLRITPDILADYILLDSCITKQGDDTGYTRRVYQSFSNALLIFSNVAELDWRLGALSRRVDLIGDLWNDVIDTFNRAPHGGRCSILDAVKKIAFSQPEKTLELVEIAIKYPSYNLNPNDKFFPITNDHVIERLPSLLEAVSYNIDHFEQACDYLWMLAKDEKKDKFPLGYGKMAFPILKSIVKYDLKKPIRVNEQALNCVERWVHEPDAFKHPHSPLEVISLLLQIEGESMRMMDEKTLRRTLFIVDYKKISHIRMRIFDFLKDFATIVNGRAKLEIIGILIQNLILPGKFSTIHYPDEEVMKYIPEQEEIIDLLKIIINDTSETYILYKTRDRLEKIQKYTNSSISVKISDLIVAIGNNNDMRLVRALLGKCIFTEEELEHSYQEREERCIEEIKNIVDGFLEENENLSDVFEYIEKQLLSFESYGLSEQSFSTHSHNRGFRMVENFSIGHFLSAIMDLKPEWAEDFCMKALSNPDGSFANYVHIYLSSIRKSDISLFLQLIKRFIELNNEMISLGIINGYFVNLWIQDTKEEDISILESLVDNESSLVQQALVKLINQIPHESFSDWSRLILQVKVDESSDVAEEVCSIVYLRKRAYNQELSVDEMKTLLYKFLNIPVIDENHHYLMEYITKMCSISPADVADFFFQRIESERPRDDYGYHPIPNFSYRASLGEKTSEHSDYMEVLRKIRDKMFDPSEERSELYIQLYYGFSNQLSPDSLLVLDEWIQARKCEQLPRICSLIKMQGPLFVVENGKFVNKIIQVGQKCTSQLYMNLKKHLFDTTIPVTWSGTLHSIIDKIQERLSILIEIGDSMNFNLRMNGILSRKVVNLMAKIIPNLWNGNLYYYVIEGSLSRLTRMSLEINEIKDFYIELNKFLVNYSKSLKERDELFF